MTSKTNIGDAEHKAGEMTDAESSELLDRARISSNNHWEAADHEPTKEESDAFFLRLIQSELLRSAPPAAETVRQEGEPEMAMRLLEAVQIVCAQSGTNVAEMVDWLDTDGGLVKLMLAAPRGVLFSKDDAPAQPQSAPAAEQPQAPSTAVPSSTLNFGAILDALDGVPNDIRAELGKLERLIHQYTDSIDASHLIDSEMLRIPVSELYRSDDYGIYGSTFYVCRLCGQESGAGLLNKGIEHKHGCPLHPENIGLYAAPAQVLAAEQKALVADEQEAFYAAKHALLNCKNWHQGDKWRFSEKDYEQANWKRQMDLIDEALAALSALPAPVEDAILTGLKEAVEAAKEDGMWRPCSGCYETEDGHPVGRYPFSAALGCSLGSGCSECGGLGAIWMDLSGYEDLGDDEDTAPAPHTAQSEPAEADLPRETLIRELHLLEEVCAFYANDEDAYLKGDGEPYAIPTEVGLKARSARKRFNDREAAGKEET